MHEHAPGIERLDVLREAVDDRLRIEFRAERPKELVPDDQHPRVVAVEVACI